MVRPWLRRCSATQVLVPLLLPTTAQQHLATLLLQHQRELGRSILKAALVLPTPQRGWQLRCAPYTLFRIPRVTICACDVVQSGPCEPSSNFGTTQVRAAVPSQLGTLQEGVTTLLDMGFARDQALRGKRAPSPSSARPSHSPPGWLTGRRCACSTQGGEG